VRRVQEVEELSMKRIICGRPYSSQILAILNEVIASSTALYDYEPRTMSMMESWFDAKEKGKFPVLGLVDDADRLMAFATYGTFRAFPAYKYSVEHSVYVHAEHRGRGTGRLMLQAVIETASEQGYHNLIAGIDAANQASLAIHQKLGFSYCGTIQHAGFKFGHWIDLQFHQLLLPGPPHPVDG